jgi:hypothetical protein
MHSKKICVGCRNPETPGICPETPDMMFGVSGYVTGVSGPSAQNIEDGKSLQFK